MRNILRVLQYYSNEPILKVKSRKAFSLVRGSTYVANGINCSYCNTYHDTINLSHNN